MVKIGIRREEKRFERRVPIVPEDVRRLVAEGVEVVVQPSEQRVFSDDEYLSAGARIEEDLRECDVVFGIKEFPMDFLWKGGKYAFFSHTIKGQPHNMPLLAELLKKGCSLVDYEKVTDEKGRRLILFSREAGVAGMVETLWALGRRLLFEGIETPFADVKRASVYRDTADLKEALKKIGLRIKRDGLPKEVVPLVVGIGGYGNVSKGAQEVLDVLPVEEIEPDELLRSYGRMVDGKRIYKVVFMEKHTVKPKKAGVEFDLQDFFAHPEKYEPTFERYLEYLTVYVNAVYWEPKYPRLITKAAVGKLFRMVKRPRLRVIGDVSCDIEGAVEVTLSATTPGAPVYTYDPEGEGIVDGYEGRGVVVMAVDILPAELPADSSRHFSKMLSPFVGHIAGANWDADFRSLKLPSEIKRAVIVHKGELTPDYRYLEAFLRSS